MADDHHYEALYEVINPRLPSAGAAASVTLLDHNDDSFDDSFDSDDAFEEVVVRGLVFKKKKMASSLKEIVFQFFLVLNLIGCDIGHVERASWIEIRF